jgi:magnesium transporter
LPSEPNRPRVTTIAPNPTALVQCTTFKNGKKTAVLHDVVDVRAAISDTSHVVWLDLIAPTATDLETLRTTFDLHPLAIEDAQTIHERPKIESFDRYLFLVIHPVTWEGERMIVHEMSIFAGKTFLITIRQQPLYPLDEIEKRYESHDGKLGEDSGFLLYSLIDSIVDHYFPIGDKLEEWIAELQTRLFERDASDQATLKEIFDLKNDVHHARRAVAPVREIIQPLVRDDFNFFEGDEERYYRDVYDHAVRVIDQLDAARDLVNSALEIHLSLVANRQNEISKQLAIIATIFLPLTYITGFFGQNFGFMVNGITSKGTFVWLGIGSEVIAFVALLAYFRVKRWF